MKHNAQTVAISFLEVYLSSVILEYAGILTENCYIMLPFWTQCHLKYHFWGHEELWKTPDNWNARVCTEHRCSALIGLITKLRMEKHCCSLLTQIPITHISNCEPGHLCNHTKWGVNFANNQLFKLECCIHLILFSHYWC